VTQAIRYLALLRGINVGGKRKMSMTELAQVFSANDCTGVQTYIQSGNVLFTSPIADKILLAKMLTAQIEQQFGFAVPVVLRTQSQIEQVLHNNPFLKEDIPNDRLHVMFLADQPDPIRVELLDPLRSSPDQFACIGSEIFLLLPNGMADTKLTNTYFDSTLRTVSTARNWRTVNKLYEMMTPPSIP
jgi:uncharacterized protein (DUF1697 family)